MQIGTQPNAIPGKLFPTLVTSGDDVFRELLVLRLAVESKLVGRLPVRHLVDLEPLHGGLGEDILMSLRCKIFNSSTWSKIFQF